MESTSKLQVTQLHAFDQKIIQVCKNFMKGLDVDDGFPCSHRRRKFYVMGGEMTWKQVYERYKKYVESIDEDSKVIALTIFQEYRG